MMGVTFGRSHGQFYGNLVPLRGLSRGLELRNEPIHCTTCVYRIGWNTMNRSSEASASIFRRRVLILALKFWPSFAVERADSPRRSGATTTMRSRRRDCAARYR